MKKIGKHSENCSASSAVLAGKRKTVWMTPELVDGKVIFVCADANCEAKLQVIDIGSIRLPKY